MLYTIFKTIFIIILIYTFLNNINYLLQAGESMVGFLHTEMVRLLRKLMARFVSTKVITSQQDITKVDLQSTENQHDNERIATGWTAREFLSDHEELSPVVVNRFYRYLNFFLIWVVHTDTYSQLLFTVFKNIKIFNGKHKYLNIFFSNKFLY